MNNFETIARNIYEPVRSKYKLQFEILDHDEFFLIGHGFALWIFIDPRDGADTWYVSIDSNGNVLTYTLMYIMEERFTHFDSASYGNPTTFDGRIEADMRVDSSWLMNKCQDILSGDKEWLKGYKDDGDYSHHVTEFLAPYFRAQGYPVIIREES